jgi:hypothetical protein
MQVTRETITPEVAHEMLGLRPHFQRAVRRLAVERYAEDMRHGIWHPAAPAPIVFSDSDELLDGQHRLHAVVLSGVTIEAWVVRGVPSHTFAAIDLGAARSVTDLTGGEIDRSTSALVRQSAHLPADEPRPTARAVILTYQRNKPVYEAIVGETPAKIRVPHGRQAMWTSPSRAALARAVPYLGLDAVLSFAREVNDPSTTVPAARTMREAMLTGTMHGHGRVQAQGTFRKAAKALSYAVRGHQLRQLRGPGGETYPAHFDADGILDLMTSRSLAGDQ